MSILKRCQYCGEKILHINPYCSKCQNVDINNFGEYITGLTSFEIERYLGRRANTLATKRLVKKFNQAAGCNTVGVHTCESCGEQISLMYRWDVKRFADVVLLGKETYFD